MMTSAAVRRRLSTAVLGAGALALLTACGTETGSQASPAGNGSPSSTSSDHEPADLATPEELTAALLPAAAFGPGAEVVTVNVEQLTNASTGVPAGATVTPEACAQDVGNTQVSVDDFGTIVAQTASTPTGITVQMLGESEQVEGQTARLDELLATCAHIDVTTADGSRATVDFAPLEVPDVGDSSSGVSFTTTATAPDGTTVRVPSLLAIATTGRRLVYLQQTGGVTAPLDPAAFTALFQDAFDAAQD